MMAVGNIHRWHFCEFIGNRLCILIIVDHPELMTETIDRCDEIILWLSSSIAHNQLVEHSIIWISEEHWLDVGIVYTYMLHAILFLITTRQFMLLNAASHVIVGMGTHHETILGLAVHRLRIDIIMFARILNQPALVLELLEILGSLLIDTWIIL